MGKLPEALEWLKFGVRKHLQLSGCSGTMGAFFGCGIARDRVRRSLKTGYLRAMPFPPLISGGLIEA
jgi:hypothetical protein